MSPFPPAANPKNYGFSYHFFVSYTTREDEVRIIKPFVDDYGKALGQRLGFPPIYYDGWYIKKSKYHHPEELRSTLSKAIRESAFTVSFLSPHYLRSEWCRFEWQETERVHSVRPNPAPEKSILPITWKRIKYSESPNLCERHQTWRYHSPVDVSAELYGHNYGPKYGTALIECVNATVAFINAWFPAEL